MNGNDTHVVQEVQKVQKIQGVHEIHVHQVHEVSQGTTEATDVKEIHEVHEVQIQVQAHIQVLAHVHEAHEVKQVRIVTEGPNEEPITRIASTTSPVDNPVCTPTEGDGVNETQEVYDVHDYPPCPPS